MDAHEEKLYEAVALEMAEKRMKPGLYAKAFADASGDKDKALAFYIKLRVEDLRRELMTVEQAEAARVEELNAKDPPCECGHRSSVHPWREGFIRTHAPCSKCKCGNFYSAL